MARPDARLDGGSTTDHLSMRLTARDRARLDALAEELGCDGMTDTAVVREALAIASDELDLEVDR